MYDPNKAMVVGPRDGEVPYGNLYKILPTNDTQKFKLVDFKQGLTINDTYPLRCERIFNNEFPVVRRAEWWLETKYGADYMRNDEDKLELEIEGRVNEALRRKTRFGAGD